LCTEEDPKQENQLLKLLQPLLEKLQNKDKGGDQK